MTLPGLLRQCELRCWSVADLARATGLSWATAAQAHNGGEISMLTAKKVLAALEANPPSETALQLVGDRSEMQAREGRVA